ncbi:uncharacterized protein [Ciconia boyciana]|uniref:uncharacterized protein isoform X3 n=1 Tax=Ciconia boyciana TaxID=52775 RepID=UPI003BA023E9
MSFSFMMDNPSLFKDLLADIFPTLPRSEFKPVFRQSFPVPRSRTRHSGSQKRDFCRRSDGKSLSWLDFLIIGYASSKFHQPGFELTAAKSQTCLGWSSSDVRSEGTQPKEHHCGLQHGTLLHVSRLRQCHYTSQHPCSTKTGPESSVGMG